MNVPNQVYYNQAQISGYIYSPPLVDPKELQAIFESRFLHQFPDAWEPNRIACLNTLSNTGNNSVALTRFGLESLPVEFAYAISAKYTILDQLPKLGFKPIAKMKNYHEYHMGDNLGLVLWWTRLKNKQENPLAIQRRFYSDSSQLFGNYSTRSGCGLRIADFTTEHLNEPLLKDVFYQYFSLLRLPLHMPLETCKLLKSCNFRRIDRGTFASYWCNGWHPDEWSYENVEKPFFERNPK